MRKILTNECTKEKPNSSALGAFNSSLISTGGNIKDRGEVMYALFDSKGNQSTRAISRKDAIKQMQYGNNNKEINAIVGTRKLGKAIERY